MDEASPFLIGHHDSKRNVPLSASLVQQGRAANVSPLYLLFE